MFTRRVRGTSYVSRQRLEDEWPMFRRQRWEPNYDGFDHLIAIGIIPIEPAILEDLTAEEVEEEYVDVPDYASHLRLVSSTPGTPDGAPTPTAQSQD